MKTQSINQDSKKAICSARSYRSNNKHHKDFRKQRKNPQKKCWQSI